mmetsp:Transcript_138422/g.240701  ORF Transcript_138422/g.240701 Transcript_138422/m.240701 type:complete len:83 (+) Transcript_138422:102-350(+)
MRGKIMYKSMEMEGGNCTFSTYTQTWKGVGSGKQGGSPKPITAKGTNRRAHSLVQEASHFIQDTPFVMVTPPYPWYPGDHNL